MICPVVTAGRNHTSADLRSQVVTGTDHLSYRESRRWVASPSPALVFSQSTEEEVETNVEIPNAQHEVIKKSIRTTDGGGEREGNEERTGETKGGREEGNGISGIYGGVSECFN